MKNTKFPGPYEEMTNEVEQEDCWYEYIEDQILVNLNYEPDSETLSTLVNLIKDDCEQNYDGCLPRDDYDMGYALEDYIEEFSKNPDIKKIYHQLTAYKKA